MSIFEPARRIPGFGLYCLGNGLSIFGTGLWCAVIFWFVWRHTQSAPVLGLVAATTAAPLLLCAVGGVTADQYNRKTVLVVSQVGALAVAVIFAGITLTGYFNLWVVLALNACNSLITAFEFPARNAFKSDIAGNILVAAANSLYSAVDTGAFALGLAMAGALIALFPISAETICAVINAVSFVSALWALAVVRPAQTYTAPSRNGPVPTTRDCLTLALTNTRVFTLLLQVIIVALFLSQVQPLLPAYASERFNEGQMSGLLLFTLQATAIVGPLMAGSFKDQFVWARKMLLLLPIALLGFALAPNLATSFIALAAMGLLSSLQNTSNNSAILTIVPPSMIGRISGWQASLNSGMHMIAAPATGYAAGFFGTRVTFLGCAVAGAFCIMVARIVNSRAVPTTNSREA